MHMTQLYDNDSLVRCMADSEIRFSLFLKFRNTMVMASLSLMGGYNLSKCKKNLAMNFA